MATVMLDDARYDRLRVYAESNGRSVDDALRDLIDERLSTRADWLDELLEFQAEMKAKYGVLPDSTPLIRQMREEE